MNVAVAAATPKPLSPTQLSPKKCPKCFQKLQPSGPIIADPTMHYRCDQCLNYVSGPSSLMRCPGSCNYDVCLTCYSSPLSPLSPKNFVTDFCNAEKGDGFLCQQPVTSGSLYCAQHSCYACNKFKSSNTTYCSSCQLSASASDVCQLTRSNGAKCMRPLKHGSPFCELHTCTFCSGFKSSAQVRCTTCASARGAQSQALL